MSSAAQGNGLADSEVPVSPRAEAAPENNSVGDFVHLENISHSYGGRKILDGLNLTLRYGEGTAIIGPSGTG